MNIIENIDLLIKLNNVCSKNSNAKLLEKRNRIRYYLLIEIQNSPEKALILKTYLEEIINSVKKDTEEFLFVKKLYREIEEIYIEALKDLTLNQKRQFFEKSRRTILNQKNKEETKKQEKVYAYA